MTVLMDHLTTCCSLTVKLLPQLWKGSKVWAFMLFRLILFTLILTPAWLNLLRQYLFSNRIFKNIAYSSKSSINRNLLDIYLPPKSTSNPTTNHNNSQVMLDIPNETNTRPNVIIFISGGAWIIGYKMWSSIIALAFAELGYIVVVPDYRNFPQGYIDDMIADIHAAVSWTIEHISEYGGNPGKIVLAGQSAGAQISLCAIIDEFKRGRHQQLKAKNQRVNSRHSNLLDNICMFIGVSGPFNLQLLSTHLHQRGLDTSILLSIFHNDVARYSPTLMLGEIVQQYRKRGSFNHAVLCNHNCLSNRLDSDKINESARDFSTIHNLESQKSQRQKHGIDEADTGLITPDHSFFSSHLSSPNLTWRSHDPDTVNNIDHVDIDDYDNNFNISAYEVDEDEPLAGFPPVLLYHGLADHTIPHHICTELGNILCDGGAWVRVCLIPEWSHTDAILESPLAGDYSLLTDIDRHLQELNSTAMSGSYDSTDLNVIAESDITTNRLNGTVARSPSTPSPSGPRPLSRHRSESISGSGWFVRDISYMRKDRRFHPDTIAPWSRAAFTIGIQGAAIATQQDDNDSRNSCGHCEVLPTLRVASPKGLTSQWIVQLAKPMNPF